MTSNAEALCELYKKEFQIKSAGYPFKLSTLTAWISPRSIPYTVWINNRSLDLSSNMLNITVSLYESDDLLPYILSLSAEYDGKVIYLVKPLCAIPQVIDYTMSTFLPSLKNNLSQILGSIGKSPFDRSIMKDANSKLLERLRAQVERSKRNQFDDSLFSLYVPKPSSIDILLQEDSLNPLTDETVAMSQGTGAASVITSDDEIATSDISQVSTVSVQATEGYERIRHMILLGYHLEWDSVKTNLFPVYTTMGAAWRSLLGQRWRKMALEYMYVPIDPCALYVRERERLNTKLSDAEGVLFKTITPVMLAKWSEFKPHTTTSHSYGSFRMIESNLTTSEIIVRPNLEQLRSDFFYTTGMFMNITMERAIDSYVDYHVFSQDPGNILYELTGLLPLMNIAVIRFTYTLSEDDFRNMLTGKKQPPIEAMHTFAPPVFDGKTGYFIYAVVTIRMNTSEPSMFDRIYYMVILPHKIPDTSMIVRYNLFPGGYEQSDYELRPVDALMDMMIDSIMSKPHIYYECADRIYTYSQDVEIEPELLCHLLSTVVHTRYESLTMALTFRGIPINYDSLMNRNANVHR